MAFLPYYDHDVFVSYGHADTVEASDFWVKTAWTLIRDQLRSILSTDVEFWLDKRLDGSDELRPTIETAVRRSAVFVSVLSPGFVRHEWCGIEAGWFEDAVRQSAVRL